MTQLETIAAIATAPGASGIAIIRISGPDSLRIADEIYLGKTPPSSLPRNSFVYGHIRNSPDSAAALDEVILLTYKAPQSYTREDVVEIQCHGGRVCAERILACIISCGARCAQPGEFTKRAFLNGRVDLVQAEAVADLISARTTRSAQSAIEQLNGTLSTSINAIYDELRDLAADVEATLDFVEDELPNTTESELLNRIIQIATNLHVTLQEWGKGHFLREGALVVISGKPNVGKSTLMNVLLGKERAIVTDSEGTTRDTLEESYILENIAIRLVDTAGIRESNCKAEREGVQRAAKAAKAADLLIYLVDASKQLIKQEYKIMENFHANSCIIVLNKCDLGQATSESEIPSGLLCVRASLVQTQGIQEINDAIKQKLIKIEAPESNVIISERHRALVQAAYIEIDASQNILQREDTSNTVLAAQHLRIALENLGLITGREYSEELIHSVFSRFCIGK